ncbi:MAG: Flp pilus assembly protein CpaB [Alphaproteobacteria bacterium]
MKRRVVILGVMALVCAGGAALMVQKWLASERVALANKTKAVQQEPTMVLVAGSNLASGQFIKPDQLKWQSWPDANLQVAYIVKSKANIKEFDGAVVRQGIPAGQPVTKAMIVQPGDRGFLAAVLNPGMRAKTVAVDATTGLAGFVFPGDRVDLILTHRISARKAASGEVAESHQVSETVLTEVRVIGIDQVASDQKGKPTVAKNVTFELTPEQVEIVSVAQHLGKLSLSVRGLSW